MPDHGRSHRAENSQSIPVAALLGRPRPNQRAGGEPTEPVFVGALLHREGHVRTERRPRQALRIVGAVAAVAVLSGVLMATTQALRSPSEPEPAADTAAAPQHITGSKVFRPDVIRAALNNGGNPNAIQPQAPAGKPAAPKDRARPAPAPGEPAQPANPDQPDDGGGAIAPTTSREAAPELPASPAAPLPTTTTSSRGGSGGGGLLCGTLPILDPVTCPLVSPVVNFYATAPSQPTQAYGLLDSSLQDGDVNSFAQSWEGVTSASVDKAEADGTDRVKVQVTYVRADGIIVVTEQRLKVSGGVQPKIVDAELLSAWLG